MIYYDDYIDYSKCDYYTIDDVVNTLKQNNNLTYDIVNYYYNLLKNILDKTINKNDKRYIQYLQYLQDNFDALLIYFIIDKENIPHYYGTIRYD